MAYIGWLRWINVVHDQFMILTDFQRDRPIEAKIDMGAPNSQSATTLAAAN